MTLQFQPATVIGPPVYELTPVGSTPPTVSDDLREVLRTFEYGLLAACDAVSEVGDLLDSPRATRLARRRGSTVITDVGPMLQLLAWFVSEGREQAEQLTGVLGPLLEPPHTGRNYGHKHGVYVRTPLDWTRCGAPANYWCHRRRGQEACRACKKAVARYEADRRRKSLVHNTIRIGGASCR
jgi:hypothetical protein